MAIKLAIIGDSGEVLATIDAPDLLEFDVDGGQFVRDCIWVEYVKPLIIAALPNAPK